jgi:hypothetical protein
VSFLVCNGPRIDAELRGRTLSGRICSAEERSSSMTLTDVIVFALILGFGACAFVFHQRSSDFLGEDVFYADCARSLWSHGIYGINGHVETNQPPGLPAILSLLFAVFGYGYVTCLRAMAVFETLGFLATYELLRRHSPRLVAAGICVVSMTSPIFFRLATEEVWPCLPVFFTTTIALLAFEEYEKAGSRVWKIVWAVALTLATLASIMIASGAIALLGAFVAVIGVTLFGDKQLALTRLKRLLPIVLVGAIVQGLWMHQKPAPMEWPLAGYPGSYLQQLKVKSGNDPELGTVDWSDIPKRIWTNAAEQSDVFLQILVRHGIRPSKTFVVIVPVLLIAAGWARSVGKKGEGLVAWYFAGYELIYLLWPWATEYRFFLPIAPLACLYLWKGLEAVHFMATTRQRVAAILLFPFALLLGVSGWYWMYSHPYEGLGLFPDEVMAAVWWIVAICAAWAAISGRPFSTLIVNSEIPLWLRPDGGFRRKTAWRVAVVASACLVLISIGVGIATCTALARRNVKTPDVLASQNGSVVPMWPDIEGGLWIRSHTPANAMVMARHVPIVYHYANRRLVWFAPISNSDILMSGIVRHGVDYVVVVNHRSPYYLPDDAYCFDRVLAKYGDEFRIVFRDSNLRIYHHVEKNLTSDTGHRHRNYHKLSHESVRIGKGAKAPA